VSTTANVGSIAFRAWLLGPEPAKQILANSYAQDVSDKLARDCRALITSRFYQSLFDTRLSLDRNAVAEFETTQGGYRLSTSVGGVVTGRRAHVIIVDDPMKADNALSEARRLILWLICAADKAVNVHHLKSGGEVGEPLRRMIDLDATNCPRGSIAQRSRGTSA